MENNVCPGDPHAILVELRDSDGNVFRRSISIIAYPICSSHLVSVRLRRCMDGIRSLPWGAALLLALLTSCQEGGDGGAWTGEYGPGPSGAISTTTVSLETVRGTQAIRCTGPADELAELGTLCSRTSISTSMVLGAGDMGFVLASPSQDSPWMIIVFGYLDPTVTRFSDHAEDIRYAAFMVPQPGPWSDPNDFWDASFGRWMVGEPLSGTMETFRAIPTSCYDGIFMGRGTLTWRNTRIEFAFDAGVSCG